MRRPVTAGLLLLFLALQLYLAHQPWALEAGSSSWIKVTEGPAALVRSQDRWYLVGRQQYYPLHDSGLTLAGPPQPLTWREIPEPSGLGVWRIATTQSGIPLMGQGGMVYPNPAQPGLLLRDPATHNLYEAPGANGPLALLPLPVREIQSVRWAWDGNAFAVQGIGPAGAGLYVVDGSGHVVPAAVAPSPSTIQRYGWTPSEELLWQSSDGSVVWQGHGPIKLPALQHVSLADGPAALFGVSGDQAVVWRQGTISRYPAAGLTWVGRARFSSDGSTVAVLAQDRRAAPVVFLARGSQAMTVGLPYGAPVSWHLLGFFGRHWLLVEALDGPAPGTYAWWVNSPE